ncbi:MAG TPA: GNAT family N-acetyltransferase [Oligoflexia bacterium]|nr:GNAT family N-acetyltransferase [Oligoflexia bacterium]HMP48043.1 GNAT family N-acetyltransferase [Oligoflexia bacterium]
MKRNINIRYGNIDDLSALVNFNLSMAKETESKKLDKGLLTSGVSSLLKNPELGFYVVAECDEKVTGSLMITNEWSDWRNAIFWWIQSVYVLPGYRRQGLYRKLYEFVKAEAESANNVCGFRLYVEKNNLDAQRAYESLGMTETYYKIYEEIKRK